MKITCEACRHFIRDTVNPAAGMGACAVLHDGWHPAAPHYCQRFTEAP